MNPSVDTAQLVSTTQMQGEDAEETLLLRGMLEEARDYLLGFTWCHAVRNELFGFGVGGVVAVFLFEISAPPEVDRVLWVVVGDLPSAYLVTDNASTPRAALEGYCELMQDWFEAVKKGTEVSKTFPVDAAPTLEHAAMLESRVRFLREEIIPTI